jgi:hypothetical protein
MLVMLNDKLHTAAVLLFGRAAARKMRRRAIHFNLSLQGTKLYHKRLLNLPCNDRISVSIPHASCTHWSEHFTF